ncbi:TerC/Alx family metal homeostasis membrane protein [Legionella tunisiensis]|uniref:TerC/Alx family metal homeostasis membrane protein n=1 Tax=Legionella tunisiensis TaxID=1034944 RepID=UPI0002DB9A0E|nr:TerC/Alx family metal homeostasis membrane protein [Legionella tunisiensis]
MIFFIGQKKAHRITSKEALIWVSVWVSLALLFNLLLWWYLIQAAGAVIANQKAMEFLTSYLIEESLSIDNMFIFIMIFNYFAVPHDYQRRVLLYGVMGAIIMRLGIILSGVFLIATFHWILYIFGLILVATGIKMVVFSEQSFDLKDNLVLRWMRAYLRVSASFHDEKFFIKQNGLLYVTPLFLVLILIEVSDLIFALDSLPAVFAITNDPFIVFTSNIFAIMGLRALYFCWQIWPNAFIYSSMALHLFWYLLDLKCC